MGDFDFTNILGEQEIDSLFSDTQKNFENEKTPAEETVDDKEENDDTKETTEVVNPEEALFGEEPESVGSEESDTKGEEDANTEKDSGASPENFYSSIASALAEDGIFPNLKEDDVKKASTAEALSDLIEAEVNARLDEKQQRISKALEDGVEPSDIKKFESAINYLNAITDTALLEESDKGETLRQNIIYQDFLNKGYSPEKARKFTERTIEAGTDIEDAKEALQSNLEYFKNEYNSLLKEAEKETERAEKERKTQAEKLRKSIMEDADLVGDIDISKDIRKKIFDNISKPIYKDPDTGAYLTALQKYEKENKSDFIKYVGLFMTLTNNFKDFDSFVKTKVKKETKKSLRQLEQTLNGTRRNSEGNLKLVTTVKDDPESFMNGGWTLNL